MRSWTVSTVPPVSRLGRAVIERALSDIRMCPQQPQRRGDDYLIVKPSEWNHAISLILSSEDEWKGARKFWLGGSGLNELEVQLEALVGCAYHSIHEAGCQATVTTAVEDGSLTGDEEV